MKMQMTKKAVVNTYPHIICVSYCALQHLLRGISPIAYTSGIYGWNADVYSISKDTAIVTGYRPFGNICPSYELLDKCEERAKAAPDGKLQELLLQFVNEAREEQKF